MRLHHHRRQCLGPVCICHPPVLHCVILAAFDAEVITLAGPAAAAAAAVVVVAVAAYVFVAPAAVVGNVVVGVVAVSPAPVEPFPAPRAGVVPAGDVVQTHYH